MWWERDLNRQPAIRPSFRIVRAGSSAESFSFEIWNPFTGTYQPVSSMEQGLRRVEQLSALIRQMWLHSHPKRSLLIDVPTPRGNGGNDGPDLYAWAEFRISASAYRTYDTRRSDRLAWIRVAGMTEATERTCGTIGYPRQPAGA